MANVKISELDAVTSVGKSDLLEIVQSSSNKKATAQKLMDLFEVEFKKVTLTSSNILSLGTAFELIAAPGSGKMIEVLKVYFRMRPGLAAYDTNTSIQVLYGTSGQSACSNTNVLGASEDSIIRPTPTTTLYNTPVANVVNQNVNLKCASGNPLTGNGELDVYLFYKTITL